MWRWWGTGVVLAALLAACGKSGDSTPGVTGNKVATSGTGPRCRRIGRRGRQAGPRRRVLPGQERGAERGADQPVDDVLGVRPGLTYEEAMNAVLCSHDLLVAQPATGRGFRLQAAEGRNVRQGFGATFAEARVVKTGKQIVQERQIEDMVRGGNGVREA